MPSSCRNDEWTSGLTPLATKLTSPLRERLRREFRRWRRGRRGELVPRSQPLVPPASGAEAGMGASPSQQDLQAADLHDFLLQQIDRDRRELAALDRRFQEFQTAVGQTPSREEKQRRVLDFAAELGASRWQLWGDRRALRRWFGDEAVSDRYRRRRGETAQRIAFCLGRLGMAGATLVQSCLWQTLDLRRLLEVVADKELDARIRAAALDAVEQTLRPLPPGAALPLLAPQALRNLERLALDRSLDVWIQRSALRLLGLLNPASFPSILKNRLRQPASGDDLFVRREAVRLLGAQLAGGSRLLDLLSVVARDPSPYVRQQLAVSLYRVPAKAAAYWLHQLACEDPSPAVRAVSLAASLDGVARQDLGDALQAILIRVLQSERETLVLRTALLVAVKWIEPWGGAVPTASSQPEGDEQGRNLGHTQDGYRQRIMPAIRRLQVSTDSIPIRRLAAQAAEVIGILIEPASRAVYARLRGKLSPLAPGRTRWLPRGVFRGLDEDGIGRILAALAQEDFGYDATRTWLGYRIRKGPVFGFRLWRCLHEFLHPSTEKRQAFRHTIGRVSHAACRAPSAVLGELSETKVPGEPLHVASEGGWRPYLPLVDDLLSALDQWPWSNRPVRFYTAEGVTEVLPPWDPVRRWLARLWLALRFTTFAAQRNWQEDSKSPASQYLASAARLGFRFRFRPHRDAHGQPLPEDATVTRFFPALLGPLLLAALPGWRELLSGYLRYFGSLYQNSLAHLLLFALATLAFFVAGHAWANWTLRRARRRIPLVLGGWGTRGKSGTERLKAAVLNALGYSVFSKSTGCEAMFLQSPAYGDLLEFPLFRPQDKATIWEHREVLLIAQRLGVDAFLWECMGLTPAYVHVLQRQWTRDDLTTITNAYPDHEDIQGPAGWNVAEVMTIFIPPRRKLLTCEQQMLPILQASCRRLKTELVVVDWLASGLITDDLLERFPYREHPDNIALVAALAADLGCDADYAIKEMADRLVPDLGVLKTFPTASLQTRRLEFSNGMSANERFATLGNWHRLGFDQYDPHRDFGTWITTVVNNRADRVARSRVFAALLVNDIHADRYFLIGTNLQGLHGYLEEEFTRYAQRVSLVSEDGQDATAAALQTLAQIASRFHQPTCEAHIEARLAAMLAGVLRARGEDASRCQPPRLPCGSAEALREALREFSLEPPIAAAIVDRVQRLQRERSEYQRLVDDVHHAPAANLASFDSRLRQLMHRWFFDRVIIIDGQPSGAEIIQRICEETPPGYLNRIMGMQNIKGVGMDFVESWKTWEECYQACQGLAGRTADELRQAVFKLLEIQDIGPLGRESVRHAVENACHCPLVHQEKLQSQLEILLARLQASAGPASSKQASRQTRIPALDNFLHLAEQALDIVDVILRRAQSRQVYRDLIAQRIGRRQAVNVLRQLNQRQKGGWLRKKLRWPWGGKSAAKPAHPATTVPDTAAPAPVPPPFPTLASAATPSDDPISPADR